MKRRIFIVLSMSLLVFSLIGCDLLSNLLAQFDVTLPFTFPTSTVDPDPAVSDRIDAPAGVALTDGTLSWSPVLGVTAYDVYTDGILSSTVTTTSYAVGVPVVRTMYTVVAKGPAGMLDSLPSVGVAFVPDAAVEIAAIDAALIANGFPEGLPGFSAELVRRGMPAAEFASVLAEGYLIMGEQSEYDPAALIDQFVVLLASVEHREALIGAIIHILPESALNPGIESIDMMIDMYTEMRNQTFNNSERAMYDEMIAGLAAQRASLTELKTMILADEDLIVAAMTRVLEYLTEIAVSLNVSALDHFFTLVESGSAESAELILVKNEIVQVLLDTMPSVDDLALLYRMMLALSNPGGTGFAAGAELLANEFAIQSLYEIELSLRFLLSSEALFEELLAPRTIISPEGDPLAPARMIQALAIDYMAFKTANADLLAAADAALDDAVDYLLFRQSIALSNALLEQSGATADQIAATNVYYDAITPELFVKMNATDELLIDRVMAYIATCDENVLYLAAVARGISYDGETWHNHATLETYDSVTEYEYVYRMTNYALRAEYFAMIDATIGTLSVDEVADLLEVLAIVLPLYTTNLYPPEDAEDAQAILFAYQALFAEDAETAVALLQQTAAYVVDNDVYGGIAALFESVNQYWIDLYGEDYCAIEGMDRSYGRYRYMLYFAQHYDALLTTETEAFLDQAIDVYYDFHRSAASPVPDAGDAYWDERQAISESHLADIVAGARACGDLDIEQLTEADEAALDAMFGALFGIFFLHDELI